VNCGSHLIRLPDLPEGVHSRAGLESSLVLGDLLCNARVSEARGYAIDLDTEFSVCARTRLGQTHNTCRRRGEGPNVRRKKEGCELRRRGGEEEEEEQGENWRGGGGGGGGRKTDEVGGGGDGGSSSGGCAPAFAAAMAS